MFNLRESKQRKPAVLLLKLALWRAIWSILKLGPRSLSPVRVLVFRAFGGKIGVDCLICGGVKILQPWKINVGDASVISEQVDLYSHAEINLGSNTVVSAGVVICTGSHDYSIPEFPLVARPIQVGDGCWIARESFLLPGSVIQSGAIVAARSVVHGMVPANQIWSGNPAEFLKNRFE